MKIFVWDEFQPDYSDGLAVAIADTVEEAKDLVCETHYFEKTEINWGPVQEFPLTKKGFHVTGGA